MMQLHSINIIRLTVFLSARLKLCNSNHLPAESNSLDEVLNCLQTLPVYRIFSDTIKAYSILSFPRAIIITLPHN
jgi:hypothetical protein